MSRTLLTFDGRCFYNNQGGVVGTLELASLPLTTPSQFSIFSLPPLTICCHEGNPEITVLPPSFIQLKYPEHAPGDEASDASSNIVMIRLRRFLAKFSILRKSLERSFIEFAERERKVKNKGSVRFIRSTLGHDF